MDKNLCPFSKWARTFGKMKNWKTEKKAL